ncbi:CsbD family protein [Aquimarina rhabdastrellae]
MEKSFEDFWDGLKKKAQKEWELTEQEIEKVKGKVDNFEEVVKEKFGTSVEEARIKIRELYDEYDELKWEGRAETVKGRAQEFWGNISDNDWEKIKGSKTRFVGHLKEKFGKSQQEALKEFDKFLKSISDK